MSLIQAGKLFHVRGPATENALSPSLVRVLGMTSVVESAESDGLPTDDRSTVSSEIWWRLSMEAFVDNCCQLV